MKTAIVLLNLGGPDSPEAVKPFLFNLFSDRAIIDLPQPFRWMVAKFISVRRTPIAQEIYAHLGGGSPLLMHTKAQGEALEQALVKASGDLGTVKSFIAMRYWHPRADECVASVKAWNPDQVILVPLYPQFSTTTTKSSVTEWREAAQFVDLNKPIKTLCCYPELSGFVKPMVQSICEAIEKVDGPARILLTAHGLPKKVIDKGDPYQKQVERTGAAIVNELSARGHDDLDYVICYQSRVGPLEWIGPNTESEVHRAGKDGKAVIMVPIAFVSEHSETLVELDIEYRAVANAQHVPDYIRVPTVLDHPDFIKALADQVRLVSDRDFVCAQDDGCSIKPDEEDEKMTTFLASGMH